MKYHELETPTLKKSKRVGRGIGSGSGKTAGRGTKGQNARTGGGTRPGFEGGQNPLMKRLPKVRGSRSRFKPNRIKDEIVHTDQLNSFKAGSQINKAVLAKAGLISNEQVGVKILSRGKLDKALKVTLNKVSASAAKAIQAAGGSLEAEEDSKPKKTEKADKAEDKKTDKTAKASKVDTASKSDKANKSNK